MMMTKNTNPGGNKNNMSRDLGTNKDNKMMSNNFGQQ